MPDDQKNLEAPARPIVGSMGDSIPHDSAARHVAGEAVYIDDMREPAGTLHAWCALSTHAHARIKSIDTTRAAAMPGVVAIVTARDVPGINDVGPVFAGDPLLAGEVVEYYGQSVACVAAETREQAARAAHAIVVEYEPLPAILTLDAARAADFTVGAPLTMAIGDSKTGLIKSKHKLSGTIRNGGQDHFYLEGQVALAVPGEDREMMVWSSTQHPSEVQHLVAKVLAINDARVTVEVRRMGGGFGGKETQAAPYACLAALLATRTGRPVKLRLDRDDDMELTGKRHDFATDYTVGFGDDGRISGIEMDLYSRAGYSPDLSNAITDRAMFHSDNGYFLGNARITGHRMKTHTVSNTAFRGFGGPQGMLAIETVIDTIARTQGLDPLDVRYANLYGTTDRNKTHYHQTVEDNVLHELMPQLEKESDYRQRVKDIRAFNTGSRWLKKGIALTPVKFGIAFTATFLNQSGATIQLYTDGSVQLNHGGTEMGQGLNTKVAQVVAEELQIDFDRVRITATNTGKVPNTSATAASSGADLNGMAALDAARTLKKRLTAFAAAHFGIGEFQVAFHQGRVYAGPQTLTLAAFAHLAWFNRISLSAQGFYATPKITWDREKGKGRPFLYYAYGAACCEVIVDTLTGENRLLRADLLHDVGRSLNPAIDIGQIEGGFIQGVGWLTTEELWWNDKGRLMTHAPSTYKIPTIREMPPVFNTKLFLNRNREDTIGRSKAVGEPPLMLGIAAFMAIRDAVAAVGDYKIIPQLDAPATPEAILKAIGAGRS